MSKPRVGETAREVRKRWQVADEVPDHAVIISIERAGEATEQGFVRLGFFEWEEAGNGPS